MKTFIKIKVTEGNKDKVITCLMFNLNWESTIASKGNVIYLEVPETGCGFSMKDLKEAIATVVTSTIEMIDIYDSESVFHANDVIKYDLSY